VTRTAAALGLVAGVAAIVVVAASGLAAGVLADLAAPPALVRAGLVGGAAVLGAYLLVLALRRIEEARAVAPGAMLSTAQLATMVRGIRFVFLAAAAFAAGIGWLVGNPLPIVVGLVIAGVDVAETSFLLLVATARGR
jgi:hypothetical protein